MDVCLSRESECQNSKDTAMFEKGERRREWGWIDVKTQKKLTVEKDLKNPRHLLHFRQIDGRGRPRPTMSFRLRLRL